MADTDYSYTKTPVAVDRLEQEIRASAIITAMRHATTLGSALTVTMADTLSGDDNVILDDIVTAHTGAPLTYVMPTQPVSIQSQPAPVPFAQPTHMTKRDSTADIVSCAKNTMVDVDFKLLAERYASGGCLVVENAELGDYVVAYVEDADGVIPPPYRAAVCEAWPIVAKYVVKEFIKVGTPGSVTAGSISIHDIETYPLNAKITAGLYLCIEYHAVDTGLTRRIGVNYHLTKKL